MPDHLIRLIATNIRCYSHQSGTNGSWKLFLPYNVQSLFAAEGRADLGIICYVKKLQMLNHPGSFVLFFLFPIL